MTAQELEARLSAAGDEAEVEEALAGVEVEETRAAWERAWPPAQVVAHPLASLTIEVLRPEARRAGRAWLARQGAVLVVDDEAARPPGPRVLATLPGLVLGTLPRMLGLGPRPHPPAGPSLVLPRALLDALLDLRRDDVGDGDRDGAPDHPQSAEVRAFVQAMRAHWRVTARWGTAERTCEVVDAPALGIWVVAPVPLGEGGDLTALRPATTTDVWRRLTALLPNDDELDG